MKEESVLVDSAETLPPQKEAPPAAAGIIDTPPTGAGVSSPELEAAEFLKKKESPLKKLLPFLVVALGFLILFLAFKLLFPKIRIGKSKEVTLTYWGLWEPKNVMDTLIAEFQKEHPQIKIDYSLQYHKDYREKLQSALAQGQGPDIFRFHNTWLPMFRNDLAAVPVEAFTPAEFESSFYPVVKKDLRSGTSYYGVPLMFDSLALFVNSEILRASGKTVPTTWNDLRETAIELTVYDASGQIKTAGVALGETANVDHWSDILALMMLQNGADLAQPHVCLQGLEGLECLGPDALTFYTFFSTVDRVWDKTLPPSTYAFATGKVAMYFGPSWRVFNIREINPSLQFEIYPAPQLPDSLLVSWATYWAEGVNKKSQFQTQAWEFIKFLAQKESLQKFYSEASKLRLFGEIPSRADMADLYKTDRYVSAFLEQAPYAQSWYLASQTWDNGLNEKIIKYFEDAVNAVLSGKKAEEALEIAAQGVSQILGQYKAAR